LRGAQQSKEGAQPERESCGVPRSFEAKILGHPIPVLVPLAPVVRGQARWVVSARKQSSWPLFPTVCAGIGVSTLLPCLERNCVRSAVGRPRVYIPMERLLELRASGLSFRQISASMGLAYSTLRRANRASATVSGRLLDIMAENDPRCDTASIDRMLIGNQPMLQETREIQSHLSTSG
jgi:hypothetical protein